MTAGNSGSDTPENDDPFAYLYRSEGGEADHSAGSGQPGSAPRTGGYGYPGPAAPHQPGVPRTSYHHVRAVGERNYGQQAAQQGGYGQSPGQPYGQGQQAPGQPGQGRPNEYYAAPETLPGGARRSSAGGPQGGGRAGRGRGRGPNSRGLLIGAIAVVAVVIVGIGIAMINNDGEDKDVNADASQQPSPGASEASSENTKPAKKPSDLPTEDAAGLTLAGGTVQASAIPHAKAKGGTYVAGINALGASVTWSPNLDKDGSYRLYVGYGVPGEDQNLSLTVNGKKAAQSLNMENFAHAKKGDWEHGWTYTYADVELTKGTNTIKLSCEDGNKCDVNLDQIWLKNK